MLRKVISERGSYIQTRKKNRIERKERISAIVILRFTFVIYKNVLCTAWRRKSKGVFLGFSLAASNAAYRIHYIYDTYVSTCTNRSFSVHFVTLSSQSRISLLYLSCVHCVMLPLLSVYKINNKKEKEDGKWVSQSRLENEMGATY